MIHGNVPTVVRCQVAIVVPVDLLKDILDLTLVLLEYDPVAASILHI